ncbi:hypothetical protein PybrP1_007048 [[Pythium] brassicae (nom. inval.)]|nr:hypothetical protein PybrP1_007048 [[Pythium] brassicae (nom. inval.)]
MRFLTCSQLVGHVVCSYATLSLTPAVQTSRSALDLLRELRHRREEVRDESVVRDLEDRGLLVLVDCHDRLRVLHAREVLDRARDADRDVQLRRHDLACLPDLQLVRHVAGVHRRARGADGAAELVRELVEQLKVVAALEPAAARDHDARGRQVRALRLAHFLRHERRLADRRGLRRRAHGRAAALGRRLLKARRAHGKQLHSVARRDLGDRVARVHGAEERVLVRNREYVRDGRDVELRAHARDVVLGRVRGRRHDVRVLHARDARDLGGLRRDARGLRAEHEHGHVAAELRGGGYGAQRAARHVLQVVLRDHERREAARGRERGRAATDLAHLERTHTHTHAGGAFDEPAAYTTRERGRQRQSPLVVPGDAPGERA